MYATQDYKIMKESEEGRIRFLDTEIEKINIRLKRADLDTQNRLILGAQKAEFQREQDNARHSLALLESQQVSPEEKARKAREASMTKETQTERPSAKPVSLMDEVAEVQLLEAAIKANDPGQDIGAMRNRLAQLRSKVAMKVVFTQPKRTDRKGALLDD